MPPDGAAPRAYDGIAAFEADLGDRPGWGVENADIARVLSEIADILELTASGWRGEGGSRRRAKGVWNALPLPELRRRLARRPAPATARTGAR